MRIGLITLIMATLLATVPAVMMAEQWQELPGVLPPARYGHTMVEIGGELYMFGGMPSDGRPAPLNDLWRFNNNNQWEQLTPDNPPAPRHGHAATVANGKMYIHGGMDAKGISQYDIWRYDPTSNPNTWERLPGNGAVAIPRYYHAASTLADGRVIVVGGIYNQTTPNDTCPHVYDPATGIWVKKNAAPFTSLYGHTAIGRDNKMYVVGGSSFDNVTNSDIWAFDPVANAWTAVTPQTTVKPCPRRFHYMSAETDLIRVFGGESETVTEFSNSWEFSFTTQSWTQRADMPIPMKKGQAAAITTQRAVEHVFFGGVTTNNALITKSYAYQPNNDPPQPTEKVVVNQIGALGKLQFTLFQLCFDKKQAKVKIELEWANNAKLKLCAMRLPWGRGEEEGVMRAPLDGDDHQWEQWANHNLDQAEVIGQTTANNKIEATVENVKTLLLLVRHDLKSDLARDVQLRIKEFTDVPKEACYVFPLGSLWPRVNPPIVHSVSLPVTPARWHAQTHVPNGIGQVDTETGTDYWKWIYTINRPRPLGMGWVRISLP